MSKILVTGVNGFVGGHLSRLLHIAGHEAIGVGTQPAPEQEVSTYLAQYLSCELTDEIAVSQLPLQNIEAVINLAGLASVGDSFAQAERYKEVNVQVLKVLGQQLVKLGSSARVIAISTGAVYDTQQPLPLTEESKLVTNGSPYAQSKILMEEAAMLLRNQGLDCIVARPFNHSGPGQAPGFLIPDLYAQIKESQRSSQPLKVGNLQTKRDYTDVRDIVRAYSLLALSKSLNSSLYNVCSGTSHSGQEVLDILLEITGTAGKLQIKIDQSRIRPNDPKDLYGSYERLRQDTGWQPTISLKQTLKDFVVSQTS